MQHLSWRVADAGLDCMDANDSATTSINVYLRDGVTWSRLKSICHRPRSEQGLGIFAESSREFVKLFERSPPGLVDQRPECVGEFLEWLIPRQATLAKLVEKDLTQRDLRKRQAREELLFVDMLQQLERQEPEWFTDDANFKAAMNDAMDFHKNSISSMITSVLDHERLKADKAERRK